MICKNCRSTSIKSRRNYTHGKKSKPMTTLSCKKCGSNEIESTSTNYKKRNRR